MIKPGLLRAELTAALPELARNPDRLLMTVEGGRLVSRATAMAPGHMAFEYRYRLNILIMDMVEHVDAVAIPLLRWIARHQPELLANHDRGDQALSFEVAFIDNDSADLAFTLELVEAVTVAPDPGGGDAVTHLAEPDSAALLDAALDAIAPAIPPLVSVKLAGEEHPFLP